MRIEVTDAMWAMLMWAMLQEREVAHINGDVDGQDYYDREIALMVVKAVGAGGSASPGVCCSCGYDGDDTVDCSRGEHCTHWWDADRLGARV